MLLQIHEPGETPLPHEGEEAVGIDLGTTNSLVAVSRGERPEVIRGILPSVVVVNGAEIHSIKRKMDNPSQKVEGKTPVEISAEILKLLKIRAEDALGREVKKAVITVPAYFDDTARTATRDAARLAGLEVLRLINEPTAAALAYGLDNGAEGIYAIYDLGGGTFDISVLLMQKGVFQVLATGGDTHLGGDDFDSIISSLREGEADAAIQPGGMDCRAALAMTEAREIKEKLSSLEEFGGVSRDKFQKLITPLVDKTINICTQVLKDAALDKSQIKGVVLVGGSTRIPLVQRKLAEFFGQEPLSNINPDEAVALGAAIQAEALTRGSNNLLLDVIPLSLGLETMHDIVEKVIYRNTAIPCSYAQEFTTFQNNQTGMIIHIVQGEREKVQDCRSLARFELKGIPPMPAGAAKVRIAFNVDADGLLTVSAKESATGVEQEIIVKPSYGLDEKEIERMILDSLAHGKEDMEERLLQESKLEAERLLVSLEPALNKYGVSNLNDKINELRKVMTGNDRSVIDNLRGELNVASEELAEKIMNEEIGHALKGKKVNEV